MVDESQREGPTSTSTPTTAPGTATESVTVHGDLPVDPARTFRRARGLLDATTSLPANVYVQQSAARGNELTVPPAYLTLGYDPVAGPPRASAYTEHPDAVYVADPLTADPNALRATLAHEYVHIWQMERGYDDLLADRYGDSLDASGTAVALSEGPAEYLETRYETRYIDGARGGSIVAAYREAGAYRKLVLGPYRYGARYANATVDDPGRLGRLYEPARLPATTEQVIHPGSTDRPVPLSVDASGDRWSVDYRLERQGELFTRATLSTALERGRVDAAATGWGNDTLVSFTRANETGVVWVVRLDDRANATEFERAAAVFAADREADGERAAVSRIDPRTVVVVVGPQRFVNGTSVAGEEGVTIAAA